MFSLLVACLMQRAPFLERLLSLKWSSAQLLGFSHGLIFCFLPYGCFAILPFFLAVSVISKACGLWVIFEKQSRVLADPSDSWFVGSWSVLWCLSSSTPSPYILLHRSMKYFHIYLLQLFSVVLVQWVTLQPKTKGAFPPSIHSFHLSQPKTISPTTPVFFLLGRLLLHFWVHFFFTLQNKALLQTQKGAHPTPPQRRSQLRSWRVASTDWALHRWRWRRRAMPARRLGFGKGGALRSLRFLFWGGGLGGWFGVFLLFSWCLE